MEESWPRKGPAPRARGSLLRDRWGRSASGRDHVPRSRKVWQRALGLCVCQDVAPCVTGGVGVGLGAGGLAGNAWPQVLALSSEGWLMAPGARAGAYVKWGSEPLPHRVAWAGEFHATEHIARCPAVSHLLVRTQKMPRGRQKRRWYRLYTNTKFKGK